MLKYITNSWYDALNNHNAIHYFNGMDLNENIKSSTNDDSGFDSGIECDVMESRSFQYKNSENRQYWVEEDLISSQTNNLVKPVMLKESLNHYKDINCDFYVFQNEISLTTNDINIDNSTRSTTHDCSENRQFLIKEDYIPSQTELAKPENFEKSINHHKENKGDHIDNRKLSEEVIMQSAMNTLTDDANISTGKQNTMDNRSDEFSSEETDLMGKSIYSSESRQYLIKEDDYLSSQTEPEKPVIVEIFNHCKEQKSDIQNVKLSEEVITHPITIADEQNIPDNSSGGYSSDDSSSDEEDSDDEENDDFSEDEDNSSPMTSPKYLMELVVLTILTSCIQIQRG